MIVLNRYNKNNVLFQWFMCLFLFLIASFSLKANAVDYSPNQVFSQVHYANQLAKELLEQKGINNYVLPSSREKQAKPMHVYELHVSVLSELYNYAQSLGFRPPPIVVSTPISYKPTDVYYLSQLAVSKLKEIHSAKLGSNQVQLRTFQNKTPSMVYQEIFLLYYRLNLLNGKSKISPSEVFSHTIRIKEDLQRILSTLARRIEHSEENERKKRLLTTAVFGTHPDGSSMGSKPTDKKPSDVIELSFQIRKQLNLLRARYNMPTIAIPNSTNYNKILPVDVFLQTQFIIAEINLLKQPMSISSTTNRGHRYVDKTPSNVYYEMQHIKYMLDRLISLRTH